MSLSSYTAIHTAPKSVPAEPAADGTARGAWPAFVRTCQRDTTIVMAGRATGIIAGIVSSVITARYLAPAGRGEYFIALTTAQLLAQFGNVGLPSSNTYFVARDRWLFSSLLANSLWISFVVVPVMAAVVLSVPIPWMIRAISPTTKWFAVAIAPFLVFGLLGSGLLIGLHQVKTFSVIQALTSGCALPFMVIAALLQLGPKGFLTATLFGSLATILIMFLRLFRQSSGRLRFSGHAFVSTFRYSTKAYFVTVAGFVVLRLNVFILEAVAGPAQVGYYSIASQISETLAILPQSIAIVLFPRLVAASTGRLRATIHQGTRTAMLLGVICAAVWILADPAVRLAFGPRFAPAAQVLRVMLPGVFLVGIMAVVSQYLAASGFPMSVVMSWFAAVALNACLGRALVARYGAVGAGLSLSLTYGALLLLLLLVCWRIEAGSRSL